MKIQVQATARRAPGMWRAGRYWPSGEPILVEVLAQDADDGDKIGQRSLAMLKREADLRVTEQSALVATRPHVDPDVAALQEIRGLEEALSAEKAAHAVTRAALDARLDARLDADAKGEDRGKKPPKGKGK